MHTGDVAAVEPGGYFRIIDRKREIIITSGGQNVSPATLEGILKRHRLIGEACVVGDRRPYPAALIVLDAAEAAAWAGEHGIDAPSVAELAAHPEVFAEVRRGVDAANGLVSHPEQIKRFTILPVEWTASSGELSATLKPRRALIQDRYADDIDRLYA
jgi:long-chain acyl-CoA synthetase